VPDAVGVDMSFLQPGLTLSFLLVLAACASAPPEMPKTEEGLASRPMPEFPQSEKLRSREGWVLLAYSVDENGLISGLDVRNSSGESAFETAALDAVRQWHYEPGDPRERTVLVNFVFDRQVVRVTQDFARKNAKVHESIDNGALDAAESLLVDIRADEDLSAFELAYSFVTEGRIASARGDRAGQLQLFRQAILNDGRWLARENYLSCLNAIVSLELLQGDYASAVRDYEILSETKVGRELAADLESSIQAVKASLDNAAPKPEPYLVADLSVAVMSEWPKADARVGDIVSGVGPGSSPLRPIGPK